MDIPRFVYHPDPIGTGSVTASDDECLCCRRRRGYIYKGPIYAVEELRDCICPWCVADGSAHEKYKAEFVDAAGIGDYGSWEPVTQAVTEVVAFRTPGFSGWQQERWWTHCADAAVFLGPIGWTELQKLGAEAVSVFREEVSSGRYGMDAETYLRAMHRQNGPTGYLFRCRHCLKLGGYSDCH